MMNHLPDLDSPKVAIQCTNPGYYTPQDWASLSQEDKEANLSLYGPDYSNPFILRELDSLSYCGVTLERTPQKSPGLLWDCVNYTQACSLLDYPKEEICWKCVSELDEIRDKQGYGPIVEFLKKQAAHDGNICICSKFILMKTGCQCGGD